MCLHKAIIKGECLYNRGVCFWALLKLLEGQHSICILVTTIKDDYSQPLFSTPHRILSTRLLVGTKVEAVRLMNKNVLFLFRAAFPFKGSFYQSFSKATRLLQRSFNFTSLMWRAFCVSSAFWKTAFLKITADRVFRYEYVVMLKGNAQEIVVKS